MAPSDKVFDILELIQLIADELSQHDLFFCCLVNKAFYTAFTPHLWHSITIHPNDPIPKFRAPEGRAGLLRNGHHIRVLRCSSLDALEPFLENGKNCTRLISLDTQYLYYPISSMFPPPPEPARRSVAMMSSWRRGSIGSGQNRSTSWQGGGRRGGGHLTGFGFGSSSTSGLFGSPALPTSEFNVPASTGFGAVGPASTGFGATATASGPTPLVSTLGTPVATGGFGGHGGITSSSSSSSLPLSSSTSAAATLAPTPNQNTKSEAQRRTDAETVLLTLLAQNRHLEFLVLPSFSLENEAVVAIMGESLLSLKEFHSEFSSSSGQVVARNGHEVRFSLFDRPVIHNRMRSVPKFTGYIRSIVNQGAGGVGREGGGGGISEEAMALVNKYPRLRSLQLDLVATINREELDALRAVTDTSLTYLEIDVSVCPAVEYACHQVLMNTPYLLSSIELAGCGPVDEIRFDNTAKDAFLRHAPTLEHIDVSSYCFDSETLQALLNTCSVLKTVKTMEDSLGYRPSVETELDALGATQHSWACEQLKVFECKITGVPRPDISVTEIGDLHFPVQWTPPPASSIDSTIPATAQQESHTLQRRILKNLGRCTHLRKLWLGTYGCNNNDPEYSYLQIRGIRSMLVDSYVQTSCLELSLASGLDELAGLGELEEFVVNRMAHRIGLAEVKWMVENWPKLKRIYGLKYTDDDDKLNDDNEDGEEEEEEPDHILWLRENRPDIRVS